MDSSVVFISVDHKEVGDIEMEFDSGESYSGAVIVLACTVISMGSNAKETMDLVIPKSQGFDLIRALLTEDQMDALLESGA